MSDFEDMHIEGFLDSMNYHEVMQQAEQLHAEAVDELRKAKTFVLYLIDESGEASTRAGTLRPLNIGEWATFLKYAHDHLCDAARTALDEALSTFREGELDDLNDSE